MSFISLNGDNCVAEGIKERIALGDKAYYAITI